MLYRIGIVILLVAGLFGCGNFAFNVTRGSGNVITETRTVSGFTSVVLAGVGELNLTQGETEGLTIQAEDNLLPFITTEVNNGVLTIGLKSGINDTSVVPTKPIQYQLQFKNLDSIQLAGAGNISSPALKAENLRLGASGAGSLNLNQMDVKQLNVTLSGAGSVKLTGQSETQTVTLTGLGSYNAGDFKSTSATVTITGAGSATVWAQESLTVQVSGAGSVSYYGDPKLTQTISGLGSLKKLGAK